MVYLMIGSEVEVFTKVTPNRRDRAYKMMIMR